MEREARVSESARLGIGPPDPLARWSGWGFLVCALIAIGYGVGALYGSGSAQYNTVAQAWTACGI